MIGWANKVFYSDDTVNKICSLHRVIIYGAGTMGRALKVCLESDAYNKSVERFLVQSKSDNPIDIDGCPVTEIGEFNDNDADIIVALNEKNMPSAVQTLNSRGFYNLILLNAAGDSWSFIKGNYFLEKRNLYIPFIPVPSKNATNAIDAALQDFRVYVVRSIYDREISQKLDNRPYEVDIQVGSALTDKKICDIQDDFGDNISEMNRKYCEITALYWIWKNDKTDYVGVSHYRRRFLFDKDAVAAIKNGVADVIVTIPVINTRGIKTQYEVDHSVSDFEILIDVMHRLYPEYGDDLSVVGQQQFFFAYNMFVMKRSVLDEYCEWLFPILFACEEQIGDKEDPYQNRYAGFLAERLLNVFLYHHRERLKIYVAKKTYLQ